MHFDHRKYSCSEWPFGMKITTFVVCASVRNNFSIVPAFFPRNVVSIKNSKIAVAMETATPGRTRVGFVGTGVMGAPITRHILSHGYTVRVYNRTQSKTDALVAAGALQETSLKLLAENSDVVFTMVGFPSDVRSVLGGDDGIIASMRSGGIVVDLTTSQPKLAAELASFAASQTKFVLDAPVTGGDIGAQNGSLSVMVGGNEEAFQAVRPILACFAKSIIHFGDPGMGQHTKAANQITIASTMIGMCEGLLYAQAAGLDLNRYITAISAGGAGSKSIELYANRILTRNMKPGFFVAHFVKDLGICLDSCRELGISLPGLALASQLYNSLVAYEEQHLGIQALIKVLERLNNRSLSV